MSEPCCNVNRGDARTVIGKSLAKVLQCDPDVAAGIMEEISQSGKSAKREIEITDSRNKKQRVMCSGVATKDDDGTFVGADITLTPIPNVTDVPSEAIEVIHGTMDTREADYLRQYFTAQIDGLYEMMIQWAGKRVAQNLEDIINETSQRNVWAVSMKRGNVTLELKRNDEDVYQALMARAITYAASILGEKQVVQEIEYINKNVDSSAMKYIQAIGLDKLYQDIL